MGAEQLHLRPIKMSRHGREDSVCERLMAMSPCPDTPPHDRELLSRDSSVGFGAWDDANDASHIYATGALPFMAMEMDFLPATTSSADRAFCPLTRSLKRPQKRPLEALLPQPWESSSSGPGSSSATKALHTHRRASGRAGCSSSSGTETRWQRRDALPSLFPGRVFVKLSADAAAPPTPESSAASLTCSPLSPLSPLSPQKPCSFSPSHSRHHALSPEPSSSFLLYPPAAGRFPSSPSPTRGTHPSGSLRTERSEPVLRAAASAARRLHDRSTHTQQHTHRSSTHTHAQLPAGDYRATLRSSPMRAAQLPPLPARCDGNPPAAGVKSAQLMAEIRLLRVHARPQHSMCEQPSM